MDHDSLQIEVPDIEKFEGLFNSNHQFLCMVAHKIVQDDFVAEDLVQEFFMKYWEARDSIHFTTSFGAFAYRSVKNSCIDYLRKQNVADKRFAQIPIEDFEEESTDQEIPEKDKRLQRILQLLDKLPAERRKVFELHALEGLSYKQIADRLGISVNTVKTQLRRAYSTLRGKAILAVVLGHLLKNL
ncbi:MAG: RNA polymerase sigma-70 factor [Candidatus Pedobacter colombiensis]|uniref:RNA polymerase sigma-70 factor n=1 Tax=Candidatus Pedobacter colombiensis TaxID=3121371 RepID=A0AAJ6B7W6_9SPHI|nr:RNA polymerase sigma-70 factor [Pedobacter sp.]WEK18483.1 MAG: RNA polymerase sigma-70 factor [Pedobacter sp.]